MANQYVNKLVKDGVTKLDLTSDTVTAAALKSGYTAHNAAGQKVTGTLLSRSTTVTASSLKSGYTAYNQAGTRITGTLLSQNTTATADKILKGYTAYNQGGTRITGTATKGGQFITKDNHVVFISSGYMYSIGTYYNNNTEITVVADPIAANWGKGSFSGCANLKAIYAQSSNPPTSLTNCPATIYKTSLIVPYGKSSIAEREYYSSSTPYTGIYIPETVTTIGEYAFAYNTKVKSVTIGTGVTSIPFGCFYNDYGIREINIPESVTSIVANAFYSCDSLTTITISKPQDSISGAPWGATNATVVWTG